MTALKKVRVWQSGFIAITISFAISFIAFSAQTRVTEIAPDAQSGIVVMYSLILNGALWLFLSIVIFHFMQALLQKRRFKSVITGALFCLCIGFASYITFSAIQLSSALIAAADPKTPPQRLTELAKTDLGYGYELDNRLARNPATPVDTLRLLYQREGQIGTDLTLAANPNTPNDILIALSLRHDEGWRDAIASALKRNPKVRFGELRFDESMTLYKNNDER